MYLVIQGRRERRRRLLGRRPRLSFTLSYRLHLTESEEDLIRRHRLAAYPLTCERVKGVRVLDDTLGRMVAGRSQTLGSLRALLRAQQAVTDGYAGLHHLFEVVRGLDAEEPALESENGPAPAGLALQALRAVG